MQNELKEKLQNLNEKFNTDLDVISLKALCNMPESEEILFAITGTLNRLMEKYPDDEEILGLLPKKEKISLEELVKILEETYPNNVEVITVKALSALSEGETKEKAIKQCLERLLEINSSDENIMEYLDIEDIIPKEKNPDMVFVEGGSYTPSFFNEERNVMDLYVNKYQTTQIEWEKYMNNNPSGFKGERRPVEKVRWIDALEFCNKMSEGYGLQAAYKIEGSNYWNKKLSKIIYSNGEEVYPDLADFSKVEGYRLPTELEWEWFARGGLIAIQNESFNTIYAGSNNLEEVAWYSKNSGRQTHIVGSKKPNELELYDCSGNVWEWCYDTDSKGYIPENKPYIYDESTDSRRLKGGCWLHEDFSCKVTDRYSMVLSDDLYGFRIVRTANPKKK